MYIYIYIAIPPLQQHGHAGFDAGRMGRDQRDQLSVGSIGGELNSRVQIRKNSKKHTQYNLAKVLFIVYMYIYLSTCLWKMNLFSFL
jgi:hypothetical protein